MPFEQNIRAGRNAPSPVSRVLILGYYDGATDGVLQLGDDGPVYRFEYRDDVPNADGCDTRSYALRPLPADALDLLTVILCEHHEPKWPAWLPIWRFPTPAIQSEIEARVDAILACAGEPEWEITTPDAVAFADFDAAPVGDLAAV